MIQSLEMPWRCCGGLGRRLLPHCGREIRQTTSRSVFPRLTRRRSRGIPAGVVARQHFWNAHSASQKSISAAPATKSTVHAALPGSSTTHFLISTCWNCAVPSVVTRWSTAAVIPSKYLSLSGPSVTGAGTTGNSVTRFADC